MGELRRGGSVAWAVGIAIAVLLVLYAGVYYATVRPGETSHGLVVPLYRIYSDASYNDSRWWERTFAPAHALDRRLRPRVWRP